MEALLCKASLIKFAELENKLKKWGFNPVIFENDLDCLKELQNNKGPRIIFLSGEDKNFPLINKVRLLNNTHYIVAHDLQSANFKYLAVLGAGANICLRSSTSYDEIETYFLQVQNKINLSRGYGYTSFSKVLNENLQVFNIETFRKNHQQSKIAIDNWWEEFMTILSEIFNAEDEYDPLVLMKGMEEARKVGAEDLENSLQWVFDKKYSENLIGKRNLLDQYNISVEKITDAFSVLTRFDLLSLLEGKEKSNPLHGARVLLVEDLAYNRKLVKKILEKSKCFVTEAVHGKDAIQKWEEHERFDIIVMDMNMPVMDGFEATKHIRTIEKKEGLERIPILALSALAMRGDRESCLKAGCDGYIPKPVEALPLLKTCTQYIEKNSELDSTHDRHQPVSNIKWVLLKTNNQIYQTVFAKVCKDLHLKFDICRNNEELLEKIVDSSGFIILEYKHDLEFACLLKDENTALQFAYITQPFYDDYGIKKEYHNIIKYPFEYDQVFSVFKTIDEKLLTNRIQSEELADIQGLSEIKAQLGIEECVKKSNGQLAIWQRSMRKVGGDLVLSHEFNYHGKFGFILADVSGHDVKAGYAASLFAGLVKGVWRKYSDPLAMVVNLNNLFLQEAKAENPHFVCSLILLWDPLRKKLNFANAGIPEGVFVQKTTGESKLISWKGIPVGMFPNMDLFDYGEIDFNPGDRLYMATDGVLEAIPNQVLIEISKGQKKQAIQEALDAIVDFVCRSIEIKDDLTMVLFEAKNLPLNKDGVRYCFQSNFKEVDRFILLAKEFLDQYMPDQLEWAMVSIALRESCCNAVEHGNKNQSELPIDVDFEIVDGNFVVSISDSGSGFDLSNVKKKLKEEGQLRFHGRGLDIMENIAQSVTYIGSGIRLVFSPNMDPKK